MPDQLDRIINIIKRTGDKVIVLKGDSEFVITSLDDYNQLVAGDSPISQLSESQMLDKINRDIALWRESQKELETPANQADFDDMDESPRYDATNLHRQDTIDKLVDDIFVEDNSFPENELEENSDWTEDFEEPLEEAEENTDSSDDFDLGEDFSFEDEEEPAPGVPLEDLMDAQEKGETNIDEEPESPEYSEDDNNINNFGYANPKDTNNPGPSDNDSWLNLEESTQEFNDFDDIPPPPDIKKE